MDMVLDFANPVPAVITMQLIGLPCDQWARYAEVFHGTVAYGTRTPQHRQALALILGMVTELVTAVEERKRKPRADILTELTRLRLDDGRLLTDEQIGSVLWNLVGGGLDTTTSLTALERSTSTATPGHAAGFGADRQRRRSLSVVQRRGWVGTGATFAPRPGESGSSDWQSATQRVGLISRCGNCNRCQFAATWNETNVTALPVLPISTTRKPSPVVGWIRCADAGYANLPGLLALRAGKRPKGVPDFAARGRARPLVPAEGKPG